MSITAPVVVGVDGSPSSYAALGWAAAESLRRGLPLCVVNVVDTSPAADPAVQAIGEAVLGRIRAAAPDATVETREGNPAAALIAESAAAAMVVVGHRGLGGFRGLLAGSVSSQLAAHALCPVVVVRGRPLTDHTLGIVVGVDGSKLSDKAIEFAFEEAALRRVPLTAVHAWRYPVSASPGEMTYAVMARTDLADVENNMLTKALADHRDRHPNVPVEQVLVAGSAAAVLADRSRHAELVVVGSRGHGGFAGLVLGSVSDALIRHSNCPVAVVR